MSGREEETNELTRLTCLIDPTDEIEAVLGHFRDEDHLNDPVDVPAVNLVRSFLSLPTSFFSLRVLTHTFSRLLRFVHSQRFHIKWKNFSHLHNTEETYAFLQERKFKGFKRIDNYIKLIWARENEILTSGRATREDLEAFAIENERVKEVSRLVAL